MFLHEAEQLGKQQTTQGPTFLLLFVVFAGFLNTSSRKTLSTPPSHGVLVHGSENPDSVMCVGGSLVH
jgi:hypothetical protein